MSDKSIIDGWRKNHIKQMSNYENLIYESIKGDTPRAKYENLKSLLEASERICFPRRGTADEDMTIYEAVELIQPYIKNPNQP